jgi:hypothetical protein
LNIQRSPGKEDWWNTDRMSRNLGEKEVALKVRRYVAANGLVLAALRPAFRGDRIRGHDSTLTDQMSVAMRTAPCHLTGAAQLPASMVFRQTSLEQRPPCALHGQE